MKVTKQDLGQYAKELRDFLQHNQIETPECLDKHLWGRFPVEGKANHFVTVGLRPHAHGRDYTITYMITKPGRIMPEVPIEVRIVPTSNFSAIVTKLESRLDGYNLFYLSGRRNLLYQDKVLENTEIEEIKQELSALCDSYAYLQ